MGHRCSIIGDIGGTHARFAIFSESDAPLKSIEIFTCSEFVRVEAAIKRYLSNTVIPQGYELGGICLAVAGTVHNDSTQLTNNHWQFSQSQLRQFFDCEVLVINDFTAQATSIANLSSDDIDWLNFPASKDHGKQIKLVVGAGTGLGVAALLPSGDIIESEGGHCDFAPTTPQQLKILNLLLRYYSRVSVERLVSGPGIANIYSTLSMLSGQERQLSPAEITEGAKAGDKLCCETITEFNKMLGSVCGDFALSMGALGGVYLSGGIIQKLGNLFDPELFLNQFIAKGRFRSYCQSIPVGRITFTYPGLLGAAKTIQSHLAKSTDAVVEYQ